MAVFVCTCTRIGNDVFAREAVALVERRQQPIELLLVETGEVEVPSFRVFEDDRSLAFMDINPVNPGHVLIIPKVHVESLFSLDEPWLTATTLVAQRVARAVQKAFGPYGMNIVQANGPGAAQSVPHFHWHVLPRAKDDRLPMNWPLEPGNREAIALAAERIRAAL